MKTGIKMIITATTVLAGIITVSAYPQQRGPETQHRPQHNLHQRGPQRVNPSQPLRSERPQQIGPSYPAQRSQARQNHRGQAQRQQAMQSHRGPGQRQMLNRRGPSQCQCNGQKNRSRRNLGQHVQGHRQQAWQGQRNQGQRAQASQDRPQFSPEQRSKILNRFDQDKDGKLSAAERKKAKSAWKERRNTQPPKRAPTQSNVEPQISTPEVIAPLPEFAE